MEINKSHHIFDQYSAYRRGVVLGLTMAEVGILIIFVLLLLIGLYDRSRIIQDDSNKDSTFVSNVYLTKLQKNDSILVAIHNALMISNNTSPNEITKLIRSLKEMANTPEGKSTIRAVMSALKEMREIKNEIEKKGGPEIADLLNQLSDKNANMEGQLTLAESKLVKLGLGKGERPCWVQRDGTIDYLYDIVLCSNGIRMREYRYDHRNRERANFPMPNIDPNTVLKPAEFLRITEPLYDSSLAENCRFFVVVYDATGPTEKDLYKLLLRTVEGHFYKRLDLGPAPF